MIGYTVLIKETFLYLNVCTMMELTIIAFANMYKIQYLAKCFQFHLTVKMKMYKKWLIGLQPVLVMITGEDIHQKK